MTKTLNQRIDDAINNCPQTRRRRVNVESAEGRIRIEGSVDTFFDKQMVQEALKRVDGVEDIENLLTVTY